MPKKKSSKVPVAPKEESDAEQENSPANLKKADEIDIPKKKSSKTSNALKEQPDDAQQEKPSTKSKKADEIDCIFASQKRKKAEKERIERKEKNEKPKKMKKKLKRSLTENEASNPDSKPRRRTNDGFAIYSEEELRLNNQDVGSTGECPFDCSCCF